MLRFRETIFDNCIRARKSSRRRIGRGCCGWCDGSDAPINRGAFATGLDLGLREGLLRWSWEREETTTKLERAHDGCLGDRRRRRTRVAAISFGEPLTRL